MTIPTVMERNESGLSSFFRPSRQAEVPRLNATIRREDSPIRTQLANRIAYDTESCHEVENNEDRNPRLPRWPGRHLRRQGITSYLEPTAEEASRFDVVINVAREVSNPFKLARRDCLPQPPETPRSRRTLPRTPRSPRPQRRPPASPPRMSTSQTRRGDTPTTPKAPRRSRSPSTSTCPGTTTRTSRQDPMTLCETIEKRTKEGKEGAGALPTRRQQVAPVSIIAYGLVQNPELSVNDAYYSAQEKSRWISPNMKLMYCLQDFQKEVSKRRLSPSAGAKPRLGRSLTSKHRATMSADTHCGGTQGAPHGPAAGGQLRPPSRGSPDRSPSRRARELDPQPGRAQSRLARRLRRPALPGRKRRTSRIRASLAASTSIPCSRPSRTTPALSSLALEASPRPPGLPPRTCRSRRR